MSLLHSHSNSTMWQRGIPLGNLSFFVFFTHIWRTTSRYFAIFRSCLGLLDQWPRPLPRYSFISASSHHLIMTTSHPTSPMCRPVKLHFGSKEGGSSSVLGLHHLLLRFATPGGGCPSLVLVIKMHQPHSILARRWLPPANHPSQGPRLSRPHQDIVGGHSKLMGS